MSIYLNINAKIEFSYLALGIIDVLHIYIAPQKELLDFQNGDRDAVGGHIWGRHRSAPPSKPQKHLGVSSCLGA